MEEVFTCKFMSYTTTLNVTSLLGIVYSKNLNPTGSGVISAYKLGHLKIIN